MFTFDTLVDTAVTNSKKVFSYVENAEIRKGLEGVVDAQAAPDGARVGLRHGGRVQKFSRRATSRSS